MWSPTWAFDDATFDRTAGSFDNEDFVDVVIHSYRHRNGNAAGDPRYAPIEARLAAQPKIKVPTIDLHGAVEWRDAGPRCRKATAKHFTAAVSAPRSGECRPQSAAGSAAGFCRRDPAALQGCVGLAICTLVQMQQMRHEHAERGEGDARQRQQARDPGQRDDAGDDGRRSQHDADLERRGGEFEVMILRLREVALFLGMLGALGQLLRAFAGFGLGAIARRGLLPVVDLLLQRRLGGIVADRRRGLAWPAPRRSAPRCGGCSWPGRTPTGSRPRHSC